MDYHTGNAELDSELDERFAILSPTVRQLLSGAAIPTLATEVAQKHGLSDEIREGIETEISMVLMYLEPVDDFVTNLMSEYLVPPMAAFEIEREVTEKLFAPLMNELGHSKDLIPEQGDSDTIETPSSDTPSAPETSTVPQTLAPTPTPSVPVAPAATSAPAPHVPVARVMPQSPGAVQQDPRASTALPNALLQNLKASLMHGAPEEPLEGTNPAPSYNAILNSKPPAPPTP